MGGEKREVKAVCTKHGQSVTWSPSTSSKCEGVSFTQYNYCNYCNRNLNGSRNATGTKKHDYIVSENFTAKYCDETSYVRYSCKYCRYSYKNNGNKGTSHYAGINEKVVSKSTCITQGKKEYYCKCGIKTREETLPKNSNNHAGGVITSITLKPTCTSTGTSVNICNGCKNKIPNSQKSVPKDAKNHSNIKYRYIDTPATCCKDGTRQYYCQCGIKTMPETIKATGIHDYSVIVKEATCTEAGIVKCSYVGCNEQKNITPTRHERSRGIAGQPATCKSSGWEVYYCNKCNSSIRYVLPMKIHEKDFTVYYRNSTCNMQGYWRNVCKHCHEEYNTYNPYDPATGKHNYKTYDSVKATCAKPGMRITACSGCGNVKKREVIPPLNHQRGEQQIEKNGNVENRIFRCKYCNVLMEENFMCEFVGTAYDKSSKLTYRIWIINGRLVDVFSAEHNNGINIVNGQYIKKTDLFIIDDLDGNNKQNYTILDSWAFNDDSFKRTVCQYIVDYNKEHPEKKGWNRTVVGCVDEWVEHNLIYILCGWSDSNEPLPQTIKDLLAEYKKNAVHVDLDEDGMGYLPAQTLNTIKEFFINNSEKILAPDMLLH